MQGSPSLSWGSPFGTKQGPCLASEGPCFASPPSAAVLLPVVSFKSSTTSACNGGGHYMQIQRHKQNENLKVSDLWTDLPS